MIQEELDDFEKAILTDIFGGYTQEYLVIRKGIFKYDMTDKVKHYIEVFESTVKPMIDERGYFNTAELKKIIEIPFVQIPEGKFRLMELYRYIQPMLLKLKGII